MNKETVVYHLPNVETSYDKGFIEFIVKQLSQGLSDKLVTILDKESEVIVKQSKVMVSGYPPTDSIEYRRQIEWSPLVRCKNCMYCGSAMDCWVTNRFVTDDGFCDAGKRREEQC